VSLRVKPTLPAPMKAILNDMVGLLVERVRFPVQSNFVRKDDAEHSAMKPIFCAKKGKIVR
jgi:hypothetical protein